MAVALGFRWRATPPPGLTPVRGLAHRFQEGTLVRLAGVADSVAENALRDTQQAVGAEYKHGVGTTRRSLKYQIQVDRQGGVSIQFTAQSPGLQYLTRLAGGDYKPQGQSYPIFPENADRLVFFWRGPGRPNRWVSLPYVLHHPGFRDVIAEKMNQHGKIFRSEIMREFTTALAALGVKK